MSITILQAFKVYVNTIGHELVLDTLINLDSAEEWGIKYERPDGSRGEWKHIDGKAVRVDTTKIKHVSEAGDYNQPEVWNFMAKVKLPGEGAFDGPGGTYTMKIWDEFT